MTSVSNSSSVRSTSSDSIQLINIDRKSTRLNSSHVAISYAVFCLKKKKKNTINTINNTSKQTAPYLHTITQKKSLQTSYNKSILDILSVIHSHTQMHSTVKMYTTE